MIPLVTTQRLINTTSNETSNATSNGTTIPPYPVCDLTVKPVAMALLTLTHVLIFIVSITGNSVIIYIICSYRNIKNPFNILIVNMATADILDSVISIPPQINFLYVGGSYPNNLIGKILCRLYPYLTTVVVSASVLTLTVIAIDRYLAIVHVLRTPMSIRAVRRAIVGIWLLSGTLFSYELYRFRHFPIPNTTRMICSVLWTEGEEDLELERTLHIADFMVKLVINYLLPLIVMIVFYTIILLHMWQRQAPGELADKYQRRLEKQKRKIIRMLVTIVTVFAMCWIPVHVFHSMLTFKDEWVRCQLVVFLVLLLISHANAAINPCLYLIFNQNFRDGLKHLINKVILYPFNCSHI